MKREENRKFPLHLLPNLPHRIEKLLVNLKRDLVSPGLTEKANSPLINTRSGQSRDVPVFDTLNVPNLPRRKTTAAAVPVPHLLLNEPRTTF